MPAFAAIALMLAFWAAYWLLLMKRLTADEQRQLIDMVEEVTWVEGPTPAQSEAVAVLKRRFAPAH